jgi:hypothetical protein
MNLQATEQTIAAPRPVTMARRRTIIYWVVSAPVLLETAVGTEWDLARIPFVREMLAHLGYPASSNEYNVLVSSRITG